MPLLRRVLGYGVITVGVCSLSTCIASSWSPQFNRKLSSNGVVRFGRAAMAVAAVSFDYKTSLWGSTDYNSEEYQLLKSQVHLRSALQLRDLCCTNGGTYIKVGQYIGTLHYLLPVEYVQTMRILHDDAPQSPLSDIYAVVEEELGSPVEKLFLDFEEKPLGAASLAQVHKATLTDGRTVAVKVQHRDVQRNAAVDLKTVEILARAVAWLFPEFGFLWLVDESKRNLPIELDFEHEGKNAEKVATMFKGCSFLKVPQIYWDLSTKRVLTMEFCDGGKVDDVGFMKEHNISCDEVSRKLGSLYSEMIFTKGFVHCDPHPGNILVRNDPGSRHGVEIVLLDHGLYHTLSDDFRVSYCKLWQSLIAADMEGIKRHSDDLGVGQMYGLLACMLTARSWKVVTAGINEEPVSKEEADELRAGVTTYLADISKLLNSVPRQLLLLFKTNDLLRSIDHRLKTTATARSFIAMSRCCVRTITEENLRKSTSWCRWLKIHAASVVAHTRISLYQLYVSSLMTSVRRALCVITSHLTSWNRAVHNAR